MNNSAPLRPDLADKLNPMSLPGPHEDRLSSYLDGHVDRRPFLFPAPTCQILEALALAEDVSGLESAHQARLGIAAPLTVNPERQCSKTASFIGCRTRGLLRRFPSQTSLSPKTAGFSGISRNTMAPSHHLSWPSLKPLQVHHGPPRGQPLRLGPCPRPA